MSAIVERLLKLLATNGVRQYGEERVSQCEHALQCALLAEQEDAPRSLVAAALLHDIGHLLYDASERPSPRGVDDRHEELGAKHLREAFGAAVAEPVRLHVAAKRYLCAIDISASCRLHRCTVSSFKAVRLPSPKRMLSVRCHTPTRPLGSGDGTRQQNCRGTKLGPSSTIDQPSLRH